MQYLFIISFLAAAAGGVGGADSATALQGRLLSDLADMGAMPMTEESAALNEHVMQEATDIAGRIEMFDTFFNEHAFTVHHANNLMAHIRYGAADQARMTRAAGAFAAAAIRAFWQQLYTRGPVESHALPFLEQLHNEASEPLRKALADGIADALNNNPVDLVQHLSAEGGASTDVQVEAMQTCITLGAFSGDRAIGQWLAVPENGATLFDDVGIWLFDGDTLGADHMAALASVFNALPAALHGIVAVFVSPSASPGAYLPPVRLPGHAVTLPLIAMDRMHTMPPIAEYGAPTLVPDFLIALLEQVVFAVQRTQFMSRPDLAERAHVFLQAAAKVPEAPLTLLAPLPVIYGPPEAFFAHLGVLWMVRAEEMLEVAMAYVGQRGQEPVFALFLVADLFSGREDATLLFKTNPSGIVTSQKAALRRIFTTPYHSYVNGIALGGRIWQFDMGG